MFKLGTKICKGKCPNDDCKHRNPHEHNKHCWVKCNFGYKCELYKDL